MINAWSLLYEELKMSENFETRYEDSIAKDTVTHSKYYYDKDRNKEYKDWEQKIAFIAVLISILIMIILFTR